MECPDWLYVGGAVTIPNLGTARLGNSCVWVPSSFYKSTPRQATESLTECATRHKQYLYCSCNSPKTLLLSGQTLKLRYVNQFSYGEPPAIVGAFAFDLEDSRKRTNRIQSIITNSRLTATSKLIDFVARNPILPRAFRSNEKLTCRSSCSCQNPFDSFRMKLNGACQ
jgi:hypothetical protein